MVSVSRAVSCFLAWCSVALARRLSLPTSRPADCERAPPFSALRLLTAATAAQQTGRKAAVDTRRGGHNDRHTNHTHLYSSRLADWMPLRRSHLIGSFTLLAVATAVAFYQPNDMSAPAVPAIVKTATPLRFVLLGATGRTALPFLRESLERGHQVTALMRSAAKLPEELRSHPNLHAVQAALDETDTIRQAIVSARPDVVYTMLTSHQRPFKAMSIAATHSVEAIHTLRQQESITKPLPLITIAGWESSPTDEYPRRWYEWLLMKPLLWLGRFVTRDWEKMFAEMERGKEQGDVTPISLMPPLLTNGPRTTTYQAGSIETMRTTMRSFDTISRADLAHEALELGEKAARGEAVPQWVGIRQP